MTEQGRPTDEDIFPGPLRPADVWKERSPETWQRPRGNPSWRAHAAAIEAMLDTPWAPGAAARAIQDAMAALDLPGRRPEVEIRAGAPRRADFAATWCFILREPLKGATVLDELPQDRFRRGRRRNEFLFLKEMGWLVEEPWPPEARPDDLTHLGMLELLDRWRREIADIQRVADVDLVDDLELVGATDARGGFEIVFAQAEDVEDNPDECDDPRTVALLNGADLIVPAARSMGFRPTMEKFQASVAARILGDRENDERPAAATHLDMTDIAARIKWNGSAKDLREALSEAVSHNLHVPMPTLSQASKEMWASGIWIRENREAAEFIAALEPGLVSPVLRKQVRPWWLTSA